LVTKKYIPFFFVNELVLKEGLLTEAELNEILDAFAMTEPGIAAKRLLNV